MRDLDTEFVDHALEAGWITDRDQRRAQRAVAKARKRGRSLYVSQALVQQGALSCDQLLELGRKAQARLYECPRCGHKVSAEAVPAPGEPFSCGRCERELEADQEQTLSLAEVLTSRDPLDLSVTLRERDPREASGSTSASSLPPFDLSRFELHEELGRGAYGVVFRATQTDLEREVALKVLRPREGELSPVALERFLREGASVARLQHPNVVRVFGIGRHKDLFVLSMELVPGESLKAFRKRHPEGRLPWRQAVKIVRGVLAGVEHAHKHGVIHRDLKPANVLIEADGARPRVIDFGLAKDLETDAQLTQGSAAVGSPAYLSPEQLRHGSSQADERCDVFSVGVMLYELLSATRPWSAKTRNDLFLTMLKDPPAPLPASLELPDGLTSVVMRMLAQDPQARFASAAAARDALGALEAGDAEPTPEPQAAAPRAARTRKGPRTAARPAVGGRSPLPWILGGAGALLVLALALTQLGSSPPAEPQVADAPPAQQPELPAKPEPELPAEPEPAPEPELLGVPEPEEPP
ncbi:MAG: protein kinase, partial [Planctomycetes bacterium]|nr:protein kinase [Planctomycetota bacterium]